MSHHSVFGLHFLLLAQYKEGSTLPPKGSGTCHACMVSPTRMPSWPAQPVQGPIGGRVGSTQWFVPLCPEQPILLIIFPKVWIPGAYLGGRYHDVRVIKNTWYWVELDSSPGSPTGQLCDLGQIPPPLWAL